jgi:aspartyl/glutamyl-tRNA(Asn/Gln) amidotransferase C subunit
MSAVTKEEILKIANLSKLWVSEEELESLTHDMGEIIEFANTINSVSDSMEEFDNINNLSNVFRPDEVIPSYPREKILQNVNGGEDGYFPVKKRS